MTINAVTAVFLGLAGFTLGVRQILLSPGNQTFPCAPRSLRMAMFIAAAALGYLAALFYGHGASPYAGAAATAIAVLSGVLALYNGVMAWNVLAQRLPKGIWPRLNRMEARVRAAPRPPPAPAVVIAAAEFEHRRSLNGHGAHH